MSAFRRFLEWYLRLPPAEAGQRTDWRFEFHPPAAIEWMPALALFGAAALAAIYVVLVYWRDASTVSRPLRFVLVALRLSAVALAALCLLQATLSMGRVGLPVIAVMIDDSASMGLEDRYADDETRALADDLVREANVPRKTRLGLTQAILTRDGGEFLRRLAKHHVLRFYHFSETASPLGSRDLATADDIPDMLTRIRNLKPEGGKTRPATALRRVLDDFRGSAPAAVVVFTDGVSSAGEADRLSVAADSAASTFTPIDPVGIGGDQPTRDIQIYDVSADELAFVGDPYTVSGKIKADGFGNQPVGVRVVDRETSLVLAQTSVPMNGGKEPVPFELSFVPTAAGDREIVIEAPPQPDESNPENNRETRQVRVRLEKIRVLLADASPRWEFRYLKTLLERDPTISLKTVLQEADAQHAAQDQTALSHFPINREDLFRYDVLILGDLDPSLLGTPTLELIRAFVRESGGGALMIAGSKFNPLAYRGTPLGDLVPFELADAHASADEGLTAHGFRPELTVDGLRGTSIFRMEGTEAATLDVWNHLPELYWLFGSAPLKPGSRVFATRHGSGPREGDAAVIAMQPVGGGKVLFHATDELWRWRLRTGDKYYGPLWTREVRYLSRSRLLGRDRTAELTADRATYSAGESPVLRVRFFDERFVPTGTQAVTVHLERRNGERRTLPLAREAGHPTIFQGQAAGLPVGAYHAWVASPSFRDAPPSMDFRVETASDELLRTDLDRRDLVETAERTHGFYSTLADAVDLPSRIPAGHAVPMSSRSRVPLWNRWEMLGFFACLIVAEWILRKRARLV